MTDDSNKDLIQWRLNRIQKLQQQNLGNDEMWNVMIKKLQQGQNLDEGDVKYFAHYSAILEESENKEESKPTETEITKAKKKGRVFLILPAIAIAIIAYIVIANVGYWVPSQTVYEINSLYDLCVKQSDVFGGQTAKVYNEKLRSYASSDPNDPLSAKGQLGMNFMEYHEKLTSQHIDDLMWNYKIHPDLRNVVSNQVRGLDSPFVENIPDGGSRSVPCETFLP